MSEITAEPVEFNITPFRWVIVEVSLSSKKTLHILSGWAGGYIGSDSWRLSSPIKNIDSDDAEKVFHVVTGSGSTYNLLYASSGLTFTTTGILKNLKSKSDDTTIISVYETVDECKQLICTI